MTPAKIEKKTVITTEYTEGQLLLHYQRMTEKTTFSICDLGGNEMLSGPLGKRSPHKVKLAGLSTGVYLLCVIDGDQLHKMRIKLP